MVYRKRGARRTSKVHSHQEIEDGGIKGHFSGIGKIGELQGSCHPVASAWGAIPHPRLEAEAGGRGRNHAQRGWLRARPPSAGEELNCYDLIPLPSTTCWCPHWAMTYCASQSRGSWALSGGEGGQHQEGQRSLVYSPTSLDTRDPRGLSV